MQCAKYFIIYIYFAFTQLHNLMLLLYTTVCLQKNEDCFAVSCCASSVAFRPDQCCRWPVNPNGFFFCCDCSYNNTIIIHQYWHPTKMSRDANPWIGGLDTYQLELLLIQLTISRQFHEAMRRFAVIMQCTCTVMQQLWWDLKPNKICQFPTIWGQSIVLQCRIASIVTLKKAYLIFFR